MPRVAVITDSTASVPPAVVEQHGLWVVPLQVVIGARSYGDGVDPDASPARVAEALKQFLPVSTSRPSPVAVLATYEMAAAQGAEEIVSVHLSSEVSATCESAELAAKEASVPVTVVDTRLVGPGTWYAAVRAAEVAAANGTAQEAAEAASARAEVTKGFFYVDTLEYLRRGGRVGAAAALLGSALAVKPILELKDGRIAPLDKVRTSSRALTKLEDTAVEAAGTEAVDVAVCHLANPDRAQALAHALTERLQANLEARAVAVVEVGAVIGAHVGPGLVGVTVAPTHLAPSA